MAGPSHGTTDTMVNPALKRGSSKLIFLGTVGLSQHYTLIVVMQILDKLPTFSFSINQYSFIEQMTKCINWHTHSKKGFGTHIDDIGII